MYICTRNRDAMRQNSHITPLFKLFGQKLKKFYFYFIADKNKFI